jgi:hypothetical protein
MQESRARGYRSSVKVVCRSSPASRTQWFATLLPKAVVKLREMALVERHTAFLAAK